MHQPLRRKGKFEGDGHPASIHLATPPTRNGTASRLLVHKSLGNILLMAMQTCAHQENIWKCVSRMVGLYEEVSSRGHFMKYLGADTQFYSSGRSKAILDILAKHYPQSVLSVPVRDKADEYAIRWPKDSIQSFKGFVAIADSGITRYIAKSLGIRDFRASSLCEGGLFIRGGDTLLVSSAARNAPDLRLLRAQYKVRFIPHPFTAARYRKNHEPSAFGKDHIDLDCTVLSSISGQALLIVSSLYQRVYSRSLRVLADALNAITYVVSDEETHKRAINLVALRPCEVIIPSGCPRLKGFLQEQLGRQGVLCVKVDKDFGYNGGIGGLGCMSSVIDNFHCARRLSV